jgi:hypothetical protein
VARVAVTALLLQVATWGDTALRAWREIYRNSNASANDGARCASSMVLCFTSLRELSPGPKDAIN